MALDELKNTWESLGTVDPFWAVVSDPSRRDGRWDVAEFMATGKETVARVVETLAGFEVSLGERVLDFGCGVGRLSNALAEYADSVVGVDIAASMIDRAKDLSRFPDKIEFVRYDGQTLPFETGSFDGALSLLVLQHGRPEVQLRCLLELQRVVRPGGVLLVQIPSRPLLQRLLPAETYRMRLAAPHAPQRLTPGEQATFTVGVTNVSNVRWQAAAVFQLGNHWLADGVQLVRDDGRALLKTDVEPGASIELPITVTAPESPGRYELELDFVHELVTWWKDTGAETLRIPVTVAGTAQPAQARPVEPTTEIPTEPIPQPEAPSEHPGDAIEMHGLHIDFLRQLFEYCGTEVLAAIEDGSAGEEWENYSYVLRRR
ncbi:class I SAM-dependent methyltransferase [Actinocrispum wychmicini]|uniref:Methyltransferase family protein n=1 Tax=Actinocrispum wychmicini TaxID=1213861 RepID=A0A4R2KDI3_9PSEU|nr:class I SAM-dependent methyltransferase [Actinocrispum wychmicini]TCO64575.1 methyltransferase family protein [Actinocrispum wychmicini]